ncbi:hypothetical protein DMUE_4483 [Dictyocoela muelleri]|nr:hypothetical protein DMUE_4483 [Dictyocoela muelleri]
MNMVFDLETIKDIFKGDKMGDMSNLVSYGLIKNSSQCICGNQKIFHRKKSSGDCFNWFCSTPDHKREVSVRQYSLFVEIRKPLDKVLLFFWCLSRDIHQNDIADILKINKNTICEKSKHCRIFCIDILMQS